MSVYTWIVVFCQKKERHAKRSEGHSDSGKNVQNDGTKMSRNYI